MSVLSEIQEAVASVATRASTAVVHIDSGWRGASGVVVADGVVLTNAHNVMAEEVGLTFADGRSVTGKVAGADVDADLCVITADTSGATALEWAPDGAAVVGTPVFAAAATSGDPRVTFGLVSSVSRAFRGPRGRRIRGSIEHTAPMASGSSGSALIDREGRLVGLNTHRTGDGFYLAIPADAALHARVDALARGETAARPHLGIGLAPAWAAHRMRRAVGLPDRDGLLVRDVEEGSPAARAGITVGDLIVSAAGAAIAGVDDLYDALGRVGAATGLDVGLVRGAEERTVRVEFGQA